MRPKVISNIWKTQLVSVVLFLGAAFAQVPDKPAGYVTDSARVLTIAEVTLINTRCKELDQTHRAQIAIVTIGSLKGEQIEKAALDLFRKWGVGRKGADDGILLLLSVGDRWSRITVGYGMERTISNDAALTSVPENTPRH